MKKPAIKYADLTPERVEKFPSEDTLVDGNPKQASTVYYGDAQSAFRTSIWEGLEPGSFRMTFPANKHEFFHLVSGKVRVHSHDGSTIELAAGDSCVIPGGFDGVFEIVEPARKYAVVAEGDAPDAVRRAGD